MSKTSIEQSVPFFSSHIFEFLSNVWSLFEISVDLEISIILEFEKTYAYCSKLMGLTNLFFKNLSCNADRFFSLDFWGPSILKQYAYRNHKLEYDRNFHIHRNFQQKSHCLKNSKMCEQLEKVRSTDFLDKDLHFFEEIPGF